MASRSASRTVMATISVPAGLRFGRGSAGALRPRRRLLDIGQALAELAAAPLAAGERAAVSGQLGADLGRARRYAGAARPSSRGQVGAAAGSRRPRRRRGAARSAVHLHVLGALRHEDLAELAVVDRLDLHGRLVGLDLGDDVAGAHAVAFAAPAIWRACPPPWWETAPASGFRLASVLGDQPAQLAVTSV